MKVLDKSVNTYLKPGLFFLCSLVLAVPGGISARDVSFDEAIKIVVEQSDRGRIIEGDFEVAEQEYFARRINFILPEISINGSLPSYGVTESFRFFGGQDEKEIIKTTELDFNSNIKLNQSLITGGDLTVTAYLQKMESEYPLSGEDVDETSRRGIFNFEFEQPLLKPSEPKNELKNKKDDLEIARLVREEELANLKKEVTEAYFGVLQMELQYEITNDKLESARLQANIDSTKFSEEVIAEEDWLESASARLDAELNQFDIDNQLKEKKRELAILLGFDIKEDFILTIPVDVKHLTEKDKDYYIDSWPVSVPLKKAEYEYAKEKRSADFKAGSRGLNGTLNANYSLGRGNVDVTGYQEQDNNTDSWGLSLNFTYPLWDGGASEAEMKAAYMTAERSKIEYEKIEKSARADIVNLINRLDVGYRKLEVLEKQIELAKNRLDIADFRMDDGQISKITYFESKVFFLEAKNKYLEEFKNYLIDKFELRGKYIS